MPHPNNLTDMGDLKGQGSYWSRKSTTQLDSMGAYCILFQQAGFEIIVLASLYSKLIHISDRSDEGERWPEVVQGRRMLSMRFIY